MNNSSVIKMIEDGLIFGNVLVPSDNYNFKKYRIAHKNENGSGLTQVSAANMLGLSDDKVISKFENNNSRIDDRTYSIFLLLVDKHPNYKLELKSGIDPRDAKLILDTPPPEVIKAARESVSYEPVAHEIPDSLKQNQISRLLGLHPKMFGKYESTNASDSNRRKPSPHTWTLFLLITKQHPYYELVAKSISAEVAETAPNDDAVKPAPVEKPAEVAETAPNDDAVKPAPVEKPAEVAETAPNDDAVKPASYITSLSHKP